MKSNKGKKQKKRQGKQKNKKKNKPNLRPVGYFKRKQKNPQAYGYRCSLHPGVFQSIDFPQRT
jgi:hypothetical protein